VGGRTETETTTLNAYIMTMYDVYAFRNTKPCALFVPDT
jgi:hypothetical protein